MDRGAVKRLQHKLTAHFALIAVLTATLLAPKTETGFLPVFISAVCIIAWVCVDRLEWFSLGLISSCLAMTVATAAAVFGYIYWTFMQPSESGQLLAVSGLLVFPEAVLFLQRKNLRLFEQLAVFLLLEMVVASLVNDNLLYAVLLAPLLLLWISALFLFCRYATLLTIDSSVEQPMPKVLEVLYQRIIKPLIGRRRGEQTVTLRAFVPGDVLHDRRSKSWLHALPLGTAALAFATLFFVLIPRTSPGTINSGLGNRRAIGLPDRLTFGNIGKILQNRAPVMRVSFKRSSDQSQYELTSPPYLRARVFDYYQSSGLERYRGGSGQWVFRSTQRFRRLPDQNYVSTSEARGRDSVTVEFELQPGMGKQLLLIPPAVSRDRDSPVPMRYDPVSMTFQVLDSMELPRGSLRYRIGSLGFAGGRQIPVTPARLTARRDGQIDALDFAALKRLTEGFSHMYRLDQYRRNLLDAEGVDQNNLLEVAQTIERHLAFGNFQYTLDIPPPTDVDLDPIEDFLINQKRGHCQFFASAMVAMLRQSGIPSRIVVGYRPKEFNALGKYFLVRQSDAHAWVEALFERQALEGTPYEQWLTNASFYWVRFDPTAGGQSGNSIEVAQSQAIDYAEKLWKDYVVEGHKLSTVNNLYAPVSEQDSGSAYEQIVATIKSLQGDIESGQLWSGEIRFAWPLTAAVVGLGTSLVLLWQLVSWLPRLAPRLAKRLGVGRHRAAFRHSFYRRCVELLAQLGLRRKESETPREFTHGAAEILASRGIVVDSALGRLTSYYYRMRFGEGAAEVPGEDGEIQACLDELEKAVANAK